MKRFVKIFVVLLVFIIALAVAIPFLIPIETVKNIAAEKVKEFTGRELTVAGDIKASVWPNIGVNLYQVSLSNPEGFKEKNLAEIGAVNVGVAFAPLLSGKVEIKEVIITKPIIHLAVNKQGVANWEFSKVTAEEKPAEITEQKMDGKATVNIPTLGKIKIVSGDFSYSDEHAGKHYQAKEVNVEVNMPSANSPIDVVTNLNFNNEKISLALNIAEPEKLLSLADSALKADIKIGSLLTLNFSGKANMQGAEGTVDLNIPSLLSISSFAGKKIDWKGSTALALAIKSDLVCTTAQCTLRQGNITFDDALFSGDTNINFAGSVPSIEAKLSADKLNLNNYLPKAEKQASLSLISDAQAAGKGWDATPIDLSGLRAANAKIALTIGELLYQKMTLNKFALSLNLSGGALALDIPSVGIYEGTAKLAATLNSGGALTTKLDTQNVQIEPLLKDFAEFDRLTGIANMNVSIAGKATSQQALMASLSGDGRVQIADGTIRGIDIGKVVSSAKAMVTGADTSTDKTKFSELGGTFKIAQGIVSNNDLAMKAPLMRLKGEGTVDLPNRYVKYRLMPSVVASLEGQGGKDKQGLEVPIKVEGNFESLSFTPDLASMVQDAVKNPEKIKDTVKSLKDAVKKPEDVKDLLKGFR